MKNQRCICKRPLLFPRLKEVSVKDCDAIIRLTFEEEKEKERRGRMARRQ